MAGECKIERENQGIDEEFVIFGMFRLLSKELTPPDGIKRISEDNIPAITMKLFFLFFVMVVLSVIVVSLFNNYYFLIPIFIFSIIFLISRPWKVYLNTADIVYINYNNQTFLFIYKWENKRVEKKTEDLIGVKVRDQFIELKFRDQTTNILYPHMFSRNLIIDELWRIAKENCKLS